MDIDVVVGEQDLWDWGPTAFHAEPLFDHVQYHVHVYDHICVEKING
jgi:hypothetical protein